jgi:hypothetical protein
MQDLIAETYEKTFAEVKNEPCATQKRSWRIDNNNAEVLHKMHHEGRAASILFFASQGYEIILNDLAKERRINYLEDVISRRIEIEESRDAFGLLMRINVEVVYRDRLA